MNEHDRIDRTFYQLYWPALFISTAIASVVVGFCDGAPEMFVFAGACVAGLFSLPKI